MNNYVIYLRKSRTDDEFEPKDDVETLARHEKTLLELARRQGLHITEIYREVPSGETIAARPFMQKLLSEVEAGLWAGVLVMRLSGWLGAIPLTKEPWPELSNIPEQK